MANMKKASRKTAKALVALTAALAISTSAYATPFSVFAADAENEKVKYYADYNSFDEAYAAAEKNAEKTVAEGTTLLKNKDKALPLSGKEKVTVLGVSADALIGAGITGGQSTASAGGLTVADVMQDAGFNVNPTVKAYYAGTSGSIGSEVTNFNGSIKGSFKLYNDVAVVVFARTGGEGSDCSRVTSEAAGTNLLGENDKDTHVALGNGGENKHYLMLTESERELLKIAQENFKKVVVVLNTSNAMEVEELKNCDGIDAVLNIDRPGSGGLRALPKILNGEVNPSGGLVDEWYADFTADPTWYNFGNNNQTAAIGAGQNDYMNSEGAKNGVLSSGQDVIGDTEGFHGIDYEEGIYLGYKYYETYYHDMYEKNPEAAQKWWEENVAYAFGYGLSYTDFAFESQGIYTDAKLKHELPSSGLADLFVSTAKKAAEVKKIYVPVKVTNTGSVAGKKTVQIYVEAPYTGKIEKSSVALVGYAKTDVIQPGASDTVIVEINVQDMASWYSYQKQSDNTTYGAYVMEAGKYTLRIMENSHYDMATDVNNTTDAYDEESFNVEAEIALEQDDFSGNQVSSLFTDGLNKNGDGINANSKVNDSNFGNIRTAAMMLDGESGMTTLTRSASVNEGNTSYNGKVLNYTGASVPTSSVAGVNGFDVSFPKAPTMNDLTFNDAVLDNWSFWDNYAVSSAYSGANDATKNYQQYYEVDDEAGYVWSHTSVPSNWTQNKGTLKMDYQVGPSGERTVTHAMYVGNYDENKIKFADMMGVAYDDPMWDLFLNQLTFDEMCALNTYCGYGSANIDSVGKNRTRDKDGPNSINEMFQMPAESLLSSTWNVEIAEERGIIIGNLGLLGKEGTSAGGFEGWYAPGADTHRTPFSGRNNEYLSQDGFQGGVMGAALTQGVQSKGIVCYTKHILMNDQETDRGCLFTWCEEQAMRENYMKCFQLILQEGGSSAGMTAYGRLSGLSNTNNTNLSVELYQKEWGTMAYFVTDGYIGWNQRTNPDMMVRAGNQTMLTTANTEYLSGETRTNGTQPTGGFYKAGETLPDGKTATVEGVYLVQKDADGNEYYKNCYTQWYCVREMAHGVLFQQANSCGEYNGYTVLNINSAEMKATEAVSASGLSVSISNLIDPDSYVTYSATGLPEGLSVNASTGAISGTPKTTGTFKVSVSYTIDGWIHKTAEYTLTVDAALEVTMESDNMNAAKVGEEFYAEITSSVYTSAEYNSLVYSVSSGKLPAGLTLSEDGEISGVPSEAGTYTFTVKLTAKNDSSNNNGRGDKGGSGTQDNSKTVEHTFTIVVAGEAVDPTPVITVDDLSKQIEELNNTIASLNNTINGLQNNIKDLESSVNGVKDDVAGVKKDVANNAAAIENVKAEVAESGCNGSIGSAAMVAALATVAVTMAVTRTAKKDEE